MPSRFSLFSAGERCRTTRADLILPAKPVTTARGRCHGGPDLRQPRFCRARTIRAAHRPLRTPATTHPSAGKERHEANGHAHHRRAGTPYGAPPPGHDHKTLFARLLMLLGLVTAMTMGSGRCRDGSDRRRRRAGAECRRRPPAAPAGPIGRGAPPADRVTAGTRAGRHADRPQRGHLRRRTFVVTYALPSSTGPISVAASPDCPTGWFCFYDGAAYVYPRGRLSSCGFQGV